MQFSCTEQCPAGTCHFGLTHWSTSIWSSYPGQQNLQSHCCGTEDQAQSSRVRPSCEQVLKIREFPGVPAHFRSQLAARLVECKRLRRPDCVHVIMQNCECFKPWWHNLTCECQALTSRIHKIYAIEELTGPLFTWEKHHRHDLCHIMSRRELFPEACDR